MSDQLDDLVTAYHQHMVDERVNANTIKARMRTLRSVGAAGIATREEVEAWWRSRNDRSPSTRKSDLANLRAFYRWAQRWEHRDDDPTRRLDAPTVPKGLPRPIARAELHTLLDTLEGDLRRAVCLGAYAGVRVAEAASLDWSDVDVEARRARVTGKRQKTRKVALSALLLDNLLPNTGGNVVAAGGKAYSAPQLERKVNRAIKAAGVDATFHQLRHRYGTLAYQATHDLVAVGEQMGHASVVTTSIYAAAADDAADKIADAVSR